MADELAHHAEPATARDRTGVRLQVTGDDAQQRRLAGPVGADEGDLRAVTDPEADVVEEDPTVWQFIAHSGDIHVTHAGHCR